MSSLNISFNDGSNSSSGSGINNNLLNSALSGGDPNNLALSVFNQNFLSPSTPTNNILQFNTNQNQTSSKEKGHHHKGGESGGHKTESKGGSHKGGSKGGH